MTTAADDSAVEAAFEAYLAGRPVPEEAVAVAAFAEAVRSTATRPGRPNAALADLLANGLLTDSSSPSVGTARAAGGRIARPVGIRRRFAMFVLGLLAKIAGAGAVAQAATGAGIVLVAFTGAGAAGVLPDPVQHGFATVAETVGIHVSDPESDSPAGDERTPERQPAPEVPAPDAGTTAPATDDAADATDGTDDATDAPGTAAALSCPPDQNFGSCVSRQAHTEEGVDGRQVSDAAHDRNDDRRASATATPSAPASTEAGDDASHHDDATEGEDSGHRGSGRDDNRTSGGNSGRGGHSARGDD